MSGAWARKYDALTQDATRLLHAAAVILSAEPQEVGAALAREPAELREQLNQLSSAGWLQQLPDGRLDLSDDARIWLTHDASRHVDPAVLHADDALYASRILDHHCAQLDLGTHGRDQAIRWVRGHRTELIAAVGAGARTGRHERALVLVRAAWDVADEVPDPDWHRALSEVGERAARDPHVLLDLLRSSAHAALSLSDLEAAEHQYGRAAALSLELGERDTAVEDLTSLVRVLLDRDQSLRAIDVLLELADLHRDTDDKLGLATTLTNLGSLTLSGDRPDLAATYLAEADSLLAPLGAAPAGLRARANELRGRALWSLGNTTLARKAFRLAEQLADVDDTTIRERLRVLLALSRDSPLPQLIVE